MKSERLEVIDLFKACACVLIVWHHLALYSPMSFVMAEWLPLIEVFLLNYALMAVQIFLVVSGYLNAKSWAHAVPQSAFDFFLRILLRYQRLAIPLLAALSVTVAITALVRPYFNHSSLSNSPSLMQVPAHIFLLQDILDLEAFSAGDGMYFACTDMASYFGQGFCRAQGIWLLGDSHAVFNFCVEPESLG